MGRPKVVPVNQPNVQVFGNKPEAIEREIVTRNQIRWDEATIVWGDADDLPLRMLDAVNKSPVAISCLGTIETFLKGSKFSDEELMNLIVDRDGTTLWQLHGQLCQYLTLLDGFAVNFKYGLGEKITSAHVTGIESYRFCRPRIEKSKKIDLLKFNPYFGTSEYKQEDTKIYSVFNLSKVKEQMATEGNLYKGQIYYYAKTRPPYKFYPIPKYWSGDRWIYADSQLQTFLKELLDNGFFQSVLINMIGDPSKDSNNPEYQKEITGTDGVKRKKATKTVGQEFNEKMQSMFSGVKKAGTAMVLWALNKDSAAQVQDFPSSIDAGLLNSTIAEVIRGITISTEVPAILANLPQQVSSLGSDGKSMQAAVEIMQSRVADRQRILEQFYNEVLLPNLAEKVSGRVKIVNYSPISTPVEIDDKFWDFLNEQEKVEFMQQNFPNIKMIRTAPAPVVTPAQTNPQTGEATPAQVDPAAAIPNEALKNLNQKQLDRILNVVARYNIGLAEPTNKKALTYEQAKSILLSYGITEAEIINWLKTEEQIEV